MKKTSNLLLTLTVIFVGALMIANILANRMVQIWIFSVDGGTLVFPFTYILSDLFSEVYGYRWSRRTAWLAAGMNAAMALFIMLVIHLPAPEWFDPAPFADGVSSSWRIVIASVTAFVAGDWVNDIIFRLMKRKHADMKGFKTRAIVSSVCGSIVDSSFFVVVAFLFTMPVSEMLPMVAINVFLKTLYEICMLPLTHKLTAYVKKLEQEA